MEYVFILGGTTFDHIVTLDHFPDPVPQTIHRAPFHETTGSTGSGKALSMTKLGIPNGLYAVLGDDPWGKSITRHLVSHGVDFMYDIDPQGTERHVNIMNANGERISMFITQSSENLPLRLEVIEQKIRQADVVVLNIISYCKHLIPLLEKYQKPVWTDLHDYNEGNPYHEPFIDASLYVFLSSDNLVDYRKTMVQLISRGKKLVVCTHGKHGATALTKSGEWIEEPALASFQIVDTNGAGDNFFSGFIYAYLNGKPIDVCMKYGSLCGAYCIASKQLVHPDLSAEFIESQFAAFYGR